MKVEGVLITNKTFFSNKFCFDSDRRKREMGRGGGGWGEKYFCIFRTKFMKQLFPLKENYIFSFYVMSHYDWKHILKVTIYSSTVIIKEIK